jgi:hypothetical protein
VQDSEFEKGGKYISIYGIQTLPLKRTGLGMRWNKTSIISIDSMKVAVWFVWNNK